MLPLAPPGGGNSPYQAYSAFAGNPLLVSPDDLLPDGLLQHSDLAAAGSPAGRGDYARGCAQGQPPGSGLGELQPRGRPGVAAAVRGVPGRPGNLARGLRPVHGRPGGPPRRLLGRLAGAPGPARAGRPRPGPPRPGRRRRPAPVRSVPVRPPARRPAGVRRLRRGKAHWRPADLRLPGFGRRVGQPAPLQARRPPQADGDGWGAAGPLLRDRAAVGGTRTTTGRPSPRTWERSPRRSRPSGTGMGCRGCTPSSSPLAGRSRTGSPPRVRAELRGLHRDARRPPRLCSPPGSTAGRPTG
jgi:hypothetical protein